MRNEDNFYTTIGSRRKYNLFVFFFFFYKVRSRETKLLKIELNKYYNVMCIPEQ